MPSNAERVTQCFLAIFPTLTKKEIENASQESVPEWDSVNHVTLLLTLSEEFAIEFAPEEYEYLTSFASIVERVSAAPPN
jgi:acyl carrier protein